MPAEQYQRDERLRLLRQWLNRRQVTSQSALVKLLRERGHDVTQSSVSRDLSTLGALKRDGTYQLPAPAVDVEQQLDPSFSRIIGTSAAGDHMLVVHTRAGAASLIALAIDTRKSPDIVGTIAGDDTLFIATVGRAQQRRVAQFLDALQQEASHV